MKKLSFLLFVFCCCALESKADWTKFYESWGDEDKDEILSCSPLLRLEIRRYEKRNQHYFDIEVYRMERNNRQDIFKKKDQNLPSHNPIREEIHLGEKYNHKTTLVTLDSESNILDIGELSLNHNFDIVTNMRLRFLDSLVSNKQVRVFSEYEVNNPERIQGYPLIVMDDRSLLKEIVKNHVDKNPQLLYSSINKDIVVFLGKTGSGKSTLINYLSNKKLKVDDEDNIILENPSDSSAMKIGTSYHSETLLPKFTQVDNLILYDLPGFGDTRGTSINLVNACFIKNIIEGAKTARLIFVAGADEVTAGHGALLRELLKTAENLLPNNKIEECSSVIITKSSANNKKKLITFLENKTEPGTLNRWIDQGRLTKMSLPFNQEINQNDRQDIFNTILKTPAKKIKNVNIQEIYNHSDLDYLIKIYSEEIHDCFSKLKDKHFKAETISFLDIKDLTEMKQTFQYNAFLKNLEGEINQSALIALLRPISEHIYTDAWNLKYNQLLLEIRDIEVVIEQEITNRKRNLLVSPKMFAESLDKIVDISELLKKSQVKLNHKELWATEVLEEICTRNYLGIRVWLDNILSKNYNTLNELNLTYTIPEVFGKNQEWVYYSKPVLYKLIFEKIEDDKIGHNYVKFIQYNPIEEEKNPFSKGVQFKRTEHTERSKRALDLDRVYQELFAQERKLKKQLEDCVLKYSKERKGKYDEKERREEQAENAKKNGEGCAERHFNNGYKPGYKNWLGETVILYKGNIKRLNEEQDRVGKIYNKKLEEIQSWYNEEISKIDSNEEDEKEKINTDINNIKLEKQRYENEVYPKTTTTDSKHKQIDDIIKKIIKPNFNINSFKKAIEFEDSDAANDENIKRKPSNKKRKRSSSEKNREESTRHNPKRKK